MSRLLKTVGLPDQSREQIDNFIAAKILEERAGEICFRYRAFLEYFIAAHMEKNADFKDWVLSEERYLAFGNEIGCYAGIKRDDLLLLDEIGDRFEKLGLLLQEETGWTKDLDAINDITPPHTELRDTFFEDVERQLDAPPFTPEERDEVLQGELPRDIGDRQEVFRPLHEQTGEQWTGCLLLYSDILKNSELVPDHRKRVHLSRVLKGWAQFTYHALLLVPALVKHRKVIVNGIAYNVLFPRSWSHAKVARGLYLGTPRAILDLIKIYLATEKMEVQLREPTLEESGEPLIVRFYRAGLYGDLKLPGFVAVLRGLEGNLAQSRYLFEAYVWKLRQMLVRLALSREEDLEFRRLISGAVGRLLPGSPSEKQRRASREMHRLEQGRLLRQLRIQAQDRAEERKSGS